MKDRIVTDLLDLKQVFDMVGIPFFLQEGCALGVGREGDILEHDKDIDIGVTTQVSGKKRRALFVEMGKRGWRNFLDSTDFVFAARLVKLNIWFYHLEGDYYVAYPDSTPGQKAVWPKRFYEKLKRFPMYGEDFYTPHPLDEYLLHRYGDGWTEPMDNEIWAQTEQLVFKWRHKMKIEEKPEEVNHEWLDTLTS